MGMDDEKYKSKHREMQSFYNHSQEHKIVRLARKGESKGIGDFMSLCILYL
jgi:hypothetical protein